MVLSCCGPNINYDCFDSFQPVLTESGICYAFNPKHFDESLRSTDYVDMFEKVFTPSRDEMKDIKIQGTGSQFKLEIILDSQNSKAMPDSYYSRTGTFSVSINQKQDYMNTLDSAAIVSPGLHTYIKTEMREIKSTPSFESLSIEDRDCKLQDEVVEDSIFQ